MGPSHKVYLDFCGTTACDEWACPLGNVKIDKQTVADLCKADKDFIQQIDQEYEENEHSLEMHIPFIKKVFNDAQQDFTLVPIMVGQLDKEKLKKYAKILLPLFNDERTLFVVSSDFCHWGQRFQFTFKYADEPVIHKSIEKLDKIGMGLIEN